MSRQNTQDKEILDAHRAMYFFREETRTNKIFRTSNMSTEVTSVFLVYLEMEGPLLNETPFGVDEGSNDTKCNENVKQLMTDQ